MCKIAELEVTCNDLHDGSPREPGKHGQTEELTVHNVGFLERSRGK